MKTIYIVGGGPSLKTFNWNLLDGKTTLAINRAFQVLPNSNYLYWYDARVYNTYRSEIDNFTGQKFASRYIGQSPLNTTILEKPTTNNSGSEAILLAIKLGYKRIYLLGYDMRVNKNESNWHNGYESGSNPTIYPKFIASFNKMLSQIPADVEIFNCNPDSSLKVFPFIDLQSTLVDP